MFTGCTKLPGYGTTVTEPYDISKAKILENGGFFEVKINPRNILSLFDDGLTFEDFIELPFVLYELVSSVLAGDTAV